MVKLKKNGEPHSTVKSLEKNMKEQNIKLETMVNDINNKFDQVLSLVETLKQNPRVLGKDVPAMIPKDGMHSEDVYEHEDEGIIDIKTIGGEVEAVREGLRSVTNAEFKLKADQERFDKQKIQIMVMRSMSTYPDHTFTIGVNGRLRLIVRGTKQWLPRCYVEVLLRAKVSSYGDIEVVNPYTQDREIKNPETKSIRYPLQVLSDPAGKMGAHWLERVSNDMRA